MKKIMKTLPTKISLTVSLVALVFLVMLLSILSAGLIAFLLSKFGILDLDSNSNSIRAIYIMMYICIFLGVVIATLLSQRSVKPIREMMKATNKVAEGDFSVKVKGSFVFELDALALSFNKMVQELKSIEIIHSDFVRNFSHEFKTPIVSIKGFAKLLLSGDVSDEEKQEYLNIIVQESERLVQLSTNILNLSKIENTEIIGQKSTYSLDEQIRLAIVMLEPKWSEKNLNVEIDLEDGIEILGDKNLIQQIWVNLLDNAIKYTESGGIIKVGLWRSGQKVTFRLEDNGCGMSDETMRHMFDKFYQGDVSHSLTGNGLGLTIAKRIIELCSGTIEVQSELGKGSVFIVKLPLNSEATLPRL
ncbi:HAMP domain-containing sensor histidine kinase [Clostridium thermopalmarium]|jgi:signal transduction histidine kinase|uniref:histidine kinase n=1 Tax=Clostridium thermopalmarium DSM 5974 TaxID=1121340 RepID=A0A2T0AKJ9_9CLOT|nr:HAMP domain-containing sensor histidine kinase [Clostridium thermopalmarium]MBE6043678.1 HAMP domain-containing histidine kinase [Clostridium thermopalmarium]PRR69106.1 Alkaline phosphatase synthesis sensor protein PhoR [Clostridium thermopalmarium DSM 5974]PVZ26543.1 signal transduction histidine kinase [Clostridium thermopalmarium DSM 5974]